MMTKAKLFLLLISVALVSSCKPTDVTPGSPITVTVTPSTTTAVGGDSLTFAVSITDNNTLKDVVVTQSLGGGTPSQIASIQLSGKSWSFNQGYKVPFGFVGAIVLTFTVDDASNTQTATATINVANGTAGVSNFSAVMLGSYKESTGSFFNSSAGAVYTKDAAKTNQVNVDMVFFYGSTNQFRLTLVSRIGEQRTLLCSEKQT
jgi:hypothetical protein